MKIKRETLEPFVKAGVNAADLAQLLSEMGHEVEDKKPHYEPGTVVRHQTEGVAVVVTYKFARQQRPEYNTVIDADNTVPILVYGNDVYLADVSYIKPVKVD